MKLQSVLKPNDDSSKKRYDFSTLKNFVMKNDFAVNEHFWLLVHTFNFCKNGTKFCWHTIIPSKKVSRNPAFPKSFVKFHFYVKVYIISGHPGWNSTTGIAIVTIDRRLLHWYQCYFHESLLHCKAWLHRYCYPWKLSEKTPRKNNKTWQKLRKTFYFVNRQFGTGKFSFPFITSVVAGYSIRNDNLITFCMICTTFYTYFSS